MKGKMMGNYKERCVGNYKKDDLFISTAAVYDSKQPYETAIGHPKYNNGDLIIVEMYDSKKDAEAGHKRWIALMTDKKLPDKLKDVSSATIAELCDMAGDNWRVYKREDSND
jgi:hypothetical protein